MDTYISHYTKVRLKVNNKDSLFKALKRMNIEVKEEACTVASEGQSNKADMKLGRTMGIIKEKDNTYTAVGDFYRESGALHKYYGNESQFNKDLTTAYAVEDTIQKLEEMNFFIDNNAEARVGPDGLIRMTAIRY